MRPARMATLPAPVHLSASGGGHVAGIDSLRALAVLAVIVFHLHAAWLPGGFVGVDVFFVISGYVVSASLVRDAPGRIDAFLARFYARRLIRIYPALLVCLLISFLLAVLFVPSSWLSGTAWKTGLLAFFGLSNVGLVWLSDGYFSPRVEFNPFTQTWSLAVEEQFYLLYPLLFFVWLRQRRTHPLLAGWLITAAACASLAWAAWSTRNNPVAAFYLLPARFWELACGALLFQYHHAGHGLALGKRATGAVLLIGLACIALACVFTPADQFPYPWALLAVAGSTLCLCAAVNGQRCGAASLVALGNPLTAYLGRASYSMYLWHWPVFVLFRWTTGLESASNRYLALGMVLVLALLSYHVVEVPTRRWLPRLGRSNAWMAAVGLVVITAAAGAAALLSVSRHWTSLSVVNRHNADWYPVAKPTARVAGSTSSSPVNDRRLFVLGDSHASAYDVLLHEMQHRDGVDVQVFWSAGCTAAMLLQPSTAACRHFLDERVADILRLASPGDVVFLPGLRVPRLSDQWVAFDRQAVLARLGSAESVVDRKEAFDEADRLLSTLEAGGLQVLLEAPKPVFPAPAFRCSDWFNLGNPVCAGGLATTRAELDALAAGTYAAIERLRQRHPGMRVWDPLPVLCPLQQCRAIDPDGRPLFFDGDHLSAHGNRILYPSFRQAFLAFGR